MKKTSTKSFSFEHFTREWKLLFKRWSNSKLNLKLFSTGNNSTSPIQLTGKMLLYPQNDRPQYTCVTFIHLVTNDTTLCGAPLINLRHLLAPISCVPDEIPLDNYIVYFSYVIKKPEDRKIIKKTVFPEYGVNFALLFVSLS